MFYCNSVRSVNFIYKGCYQMNLCFSFSLFLVTLTNAESWRNQVLNLEERRRKETASNILLTKILGNKARQYPHLCIIIYDMHSTSDYSLLSNEWKSFDSLLDTTWMKVAVPLKLITHNVLPCLVFQSRPLFSTFHTCILIFFPLIGLITPFQNSAINHFDVTSDCSDFLILVLVCCAVKGN